MSDLISRSEAIKLLRKNMSNDIQDQIATENNINLIESLPTAFDTEKVVEQLEREAERWESSGKEYNDRCEIAVGRGLRNSINIVKKGGVE